MGVQVGDRIYYTGDQANRAGWFKVTGVLEDKLALEHEETGEGKFISPWLLGYVYDGTGRFRFVTDAAYRAYRNAVGAALERALGAKACR